MRVLLINDSTTNSNWGDRAAAISLMAMIDASGGEVTHVVSEDNLRLSSFGDLPDQPDEIVRNRGREIAKLFIPPLILRIRRRILTNPDSTHASRLIPDKWDDFDTAAAAALREKRHGWPTLLGAIDDADVVVIHGDGAMVGNGVVPRTDLFLTYLVKKHVRKPVTIVNHSADFDHPDLRWMAQEVYPLFDDVVFRDPLSADRCKTMCAGRFAADTAFWFKPAPLDSWAPIARRLTYFDIWPDTAPFDPSRPYLCIGGSSIQCTAWRPAEITEDYVALVKHLQGVYGGQIVVTVSGLQELEVFRPLAARLGLPLIAPTIPVQQAVDILGHADAYIGGRWHTAIFALRGGTPVVALSAKQAKMSSLMLAAGLPTTAFDAFDLASNKVGIGRALVDHLERGDSLRSELRKWADRMAENSWDNVTYLTGYRQARCPVGGKGLND